MAAADQRQPGQGFGQAVGCLRPPAARMSQQAARGRHRHLLPGGALGQRGPRRMRLDGGEHGIGLGPAGAGQAVQVLQVQEGLHLVMHPAGQVAGQRIPAVAHRHAGQFQPGQQRHGAHLVLRVAGVHTPHLLVVQRQGRGIIAQLDVEQRQVPPQVAAHEAGERAPRCADLVHQVRAFGQAAVGQHHMGQRMLGPGFGRLHGQRAAGCRLGQVEPVALLPAEGGQAVHRRHLGCGGHRRQGQLQQRGCVAQVEGVVLAQLDGSQVARVVVRQRGVQRQRAADVAVDPAGHRLGHAALAVGGRQVGGAGAGQVGAGLGRAGGRFTEHPQHGRPGLHHQAVVHIGRRQHLQDAGRVAQEAVDEAVHRRRAVGVLQRDRVAEGVGGGVHGRAHPQLSADRSLAEIGMSFHTPFSRAAATVMAVGWYR